MREATGELNMTVVIVVIIGALAAFLYTGLWPMLRNNMAKNTKCSDAICKLNGTETPDQDGNITCEYHDKKTDEIIELTCPWKG